MSTTATGNSSNPQNVGASSARPTYSASSPTYSGLRDRRNGPCSMIAFVACPGRSPVWCRPNSHSDQPFQTRKNSTSAQPTGTRHPPSSTGSPQASVATQPASQGRPIANGGQSRYATVSPGPYAMPPLSWPRAVSANRGLDDLARAHDTEPYGS